MIFVFATLYVFIGLGFSTICDQIEPCVSRAAFIGRVLLWPVWLAIIGGFSFFL